MFAYVGGSELGVAVPRWVVAAYARRHRKTECDTTVFAVCEQPHAGARRYVVRLFWSVLPGCSVLDFVLHWGRYSCDPEPTWRWWQRLGVCRVQQPRHASRASLCELHVAVLAMGWRMAGPDWTGRGPTALRRRHVQFQASLDAFSTHPATRAPRGYTSTRMGGTAKGITQVGRRAGIAAAVRLSRAPLTAPQL